MRRTIWLGMALLISMVWAGSGGARGRSAESAPQPLPPGWTVTTAPEWDALFDRDSGWTGADGIYSFPVSADETPGSATDTLFVFGDTFIGEVIDNQRQPGTILVNNTVARLTGSAPDPAAARFAWGEFGLGSDSAVFIPDTPTAQPDDFYWPNDGVVIGDKLYFYAVRLELTGAGGMFGFAVNGVALLTVDLSRTNPLRHVTQVDTPFFVPANDVRGDILVGHAVMPNTAAAGAPFPDGYIYVYGHQNDPFNKKLIAARVLPEAIADFDAYEYWDGSGWSDQIDDLAPITSRLSSEFSVTPLPSGRYILVFQRDTLGPNTAFRLGDSPVGPFGDLTNIYRCPEADEGMMCYNAKAHPHLSDPDALLISYNVNTGFEMSFWDHFSNADIYRPRFIRLSYAQP